MNITSWIWHCSSRFHHGSLLHLRRLHGLGEDKEILPLHRDRCCWWDAKEGWSLGKVRTTGKICVCACACAVEARLRNFTFTLSRYTTTVKDMRGFQACDLVAFVQAERQIDRFTEESLMPAQAWYYSTLLQTLECCLLKSIIYTNVNASFDRGGVRI